MKVNGSKLYSVKSIIENSKIKDDISIYLTNRKSTTNLSWGSSVLIELYNTDGIEINDEIKIFNNITTQTFTVLNVVKKYIIISMLSSENIKFTDYRDSILDKTYSVYNSDIEMHIKESNVNKVYKEVMVDMKNLTPVSSDFGNKMKLVVDSVGDVVVYDLSVDFYLTVGDWLNTVNFDLVVADEDEYKPIIRGLQFTEKLDDYKYLVFKYPTNTGYNKVIFTTKSIDTSYNIFPDFYFDSSVFFNISTDPEPPIIYEGFVESSNSDIDDASNIITTKAYFGRNIITNEIIKNYKWNGSIEENNDIDVDTYDVYYIINTNKILSTINGSNIISCEQDVRNFIFIGEKIHFKISGVIYSYEVIKFDYNITSAGKTTIQISELYDGPTSVLANLYRYGEAYDTTEFVANCSESNIIEIDGDITEWLWNQKTLELYDSSNNTKPTIKSYDYNVTTVGKTTIITNESMIAESATLRFTLRILVVDENIFLISSSVNYAKIYDLAGLVVEGEYTNISGTVESYRIAGVCLKNPYVDEYDSIFTSYVPAVNIENNISKRFVFIL